MMKRTRNFILSLSLAAGLAVSLGGCDRIEIKNQNFKKDTKSRVTKTVTEITQPKRVTKATFKTPALITNYNSVTAAEIITRAHKAAGGLTWARPESLSKSGFAIYYKNGQSLSHETHKMWRVFGPDRLSERDDQVRIYSVRDGEAVINISYDGQTTYTDKGAQPKTAADRGWSSNFGFGSIRHALETGYQLERLPDDMVDGTSAFMVRVTDPSGHPTTFAISHEGYKILMAGFETARGWHERIYSDFYSNPGDDWMQPGRERLFYNGEKTNEIIWERYAINQELPACIFVLPQAQNCQ